MTTYCLQCTLPLSLDDIRDSAVDHCVCYQWNALHIDQTQLSKHAILFHALEKQKRNSTGRLISKLSRIQNATWHRQKNEAQMHQFKDFKLVYPSKENQHALIKPEDRLLFIDSTWQQSRKMLRQSPWLNELPRVGLSLNYTSQYSLRRNQVKDGLSTLETLSLCLIEQGHSRTGEDLIKFLRLFQNAFSNARQAGRFRTGTIS